MTAGDPTVRWHLRPDLQAVLLAPTGELLLQQWLANGSATTIKAARHRTIYRVRLNHPAQLDFYLKEYRAVGPRNRLRELLRSTKAKSEHEKAAELFQRGIAAPRPLGWGVLGNAMAPRASFLLSETVADAQHLTETLAGLTPQRQHELSIELGRYVAQLHAAGVTHHDFHPGNLLVRWTGDDPRFVLIDLHEVQLGRPLSWRQRSQNLCVFNRYFILRASRTDRLRFWRAYAREAAAVLPDHPSASPTALEAASEESNRQFWIAREKKYVGDSRLVTRFRHHTIGGLMARSFPAEHGQELAEHLDRWFDAAHARQLKAGGASSVAVTPFGVIKRFNVRSRWTGWKNRLRRSPAWRSWINSYSLGDAGLPAPEPLLYLHQPDATEYLLTSELKQVQDLRQFADRHTEFSLTCWRERLRVVARTLRQLHDRHFGHRDLKAGNLLTPINADDHRVWFVDLVGVHRRRRVSRSASVKDLARLGASFLNHPALTHGDRLRFLFAYFGAASHRRAGWRRWWRELAEAAQAKVDRTRARGRAMG